MPHDESLVFRILRLLGQHPNRSLEQQRLVHEIDRQTDGGYPPDAVLSHLGRMQSFGLIKSVRVSNGHTLYQLGWAGLDYLDDR